MIAQTHPVKDTEMAASAQQTCGSVTVSQPAMTFRGCSAHLSELLLLCRSAGGGKGFGGLRAVRPLGVPDVQQHVGVLLEHLGRPDAVHVAVVHPHPLTCAHHIPVMSERQMTGMVAIGSGEGTDIDPEGEHRVMCYVLIMSDRVTGGNRHPGERRRPWPSFTKA